MKKNNMSAQSAWIIRLSFLSIVLLPSSSFACGDCSCETRVNVWWPQFQGLYNSGLSSIQNAISSATAAINITDVLPTPGAGLTPEIFFQKQSIVQAIEANTTAAGKIHDAAAADAVTNRNLQMQVQAANEYPQANLASSSPVQAQKTLCALTTASGTRTTVPGSTTPVQPQEAARQSAVVYSSQNTSASMQQGNNNVIRTNTAVTASMQFCDPAIDGSTCTNTTQPKLLDLDPQRIYGGIPDPVTGVFSGIDTFTAAQHAASQMFGNWIVGPAPEPVPQAGRNTSQGLQASFAQRRAMALRALAMRETNEENSRHEGVLVASATSTAANGANIASALQAAGLPDPTVNGKVSQAAVEKANYWAPAWNSNMYAAGTATPIADIDRELLIAMRLHTSLKYERLQLARENNQVMSGILAILINPIDKPSTALASDEKPAGKIAGKIHKGLADASPDHHEKVSSLTHAADLADATAAEIRVSDTNSDRASH